MRRSASVESIADALGDLDLHRTFSRANVPKWTADLQSLGELVHAIADELRAAFRSGAIVGAAGEVLEPKRIADVDSRLRRALHGEGEVGRARGRLLCTLPSWRGMFAFARAPGATVGSLDLAELEALGQRLRSASATIRGMEHLFSGRLLAEAYVGEGCHPDVAAANVVELCEARGVPRALAARAAYELGIERVDVGDTGADPAERIADRWRKAATTQRAKAPAKRNRRK